MYYNNILETIGNMATIRYSATSTANMPRYPEVGNTQYAIAENTDIPPTVHKAPDARPEVLRSLGFFCRKLSTRKIANPMGTARYTPRENVVRHA